MLDFALNQVTMSHAALDGFLETAKDLGCIGVELRNDLGRPLFDGMPVKDASAMVQDQGLRLLGLSQIYPCNRWSTDIATESQTLIEIATEAGAESISLIPCNDGTRLDSQDRIDDLTRGFQGILPMLQDARMTAYVEPLGFERASLRLKSEAIAVIRSLDAQDNIKLVHDTFHHTLAGDTTIYPEHTGIVHISGLTEVALDVSEMEDEHRVLINENDRLGNLSQITALIEGGYTGAFSFECFAPEIHEISKPLDALRQSMNFIASHMQQKAA